MLVVAVALTLMTQSRGDAPSSVPTTNAAGIESCNHGPVTWRWSDLEYFVFACADGPLIVQPANADRPWFWVYPFEYGGYRVTWSGEMSPAEYEAMVVWYNMPPDDVRAIHASALSGSEDGR